WRILERRIQVGGCFAWVSQACVQGFPIRSTLNHAASTSESRGECLDPGLASNRRATDEPDFLVLRNTLDNQGRSRASTRISLRAEGAHRRKVPLQADRCVLGLLPLSGCRAHRAS